MVYRTKVNITSSNYDFQWCHVSTMNALKSKPTGLPFPKIVDDFSDDESCFLHYP
jgi:hypothetical protein